MWSWEDASTAYPETMFTGNPWNVFLYGPDPETDVQDLAQPNTGDEGSDGPDVMEDILPKLESILFIC